MFQDNLSGPGKQVAKTQSKDKTKTKKLKVLRNFDKESDFIKKLNLLKQ